MKLPLPFLLLSACFAFSPIVHAQRSTISVRIEQESKQESPPKDYHTKTQKRTLKIFLSNSSKEETNVKIKYTYFGHAIASHDVVPIDQGEKDATLKPLETQEVDAPTSSQTYTDEHYEGMGKGPKKKVEATGNKLTGYGVQVLVDDKVVAESYDPPTMKDLMDKAPAAPGATPPKKK